ncbi:RNA polymerase sigma factor [Prolixibacter sp. SD074]|uniref:RNA polymerase sigma factor n=1 Tax=Prolixibacter sp. SD074 TaxID=2652391 RepID=UPI001278EB71|nr:sigma-70 family RNA polymerase sigma factor [Prolixibacter sp. SD074]GET28502.1 hypothetical protein SD074_07040 [Prolixibacter sp. SD074]
MMTREDNELFDQIKKGNLKAFSVLFELYYQPLCGFAFVFVPEKEVAEELAANVFINLWKNKKHIAVRSSLKAYLFSAAKNQAFSHLRKQKTVLLPIEQFFGLPARKDTIPETICIENELKTEFERIFRKLPPRAKLAFNCTVLTI